MTKLLTSQHPIDREFALLRASYAEEVVMANALAKRTWASLFKPSKHCHYCGEPNVYASGTWKGFCSSTCAVQYCAMPRTK